MKKYSNPDQIKNFQNILKQLPNYKINNKKSTFNQIKKNTKNKNFEYSINSISSIFEISNSEIEIIIKYNKKTFKKTLNKIKKLNIKNSNYHY